MTRLEFAKARAMQRIERGEVYDGLMQFAHSLDGNIFDHFLLLARKGILESISPRQAILLLGEFTDTDE